MIAGAGEHQLASALSAAELADGDDDVMKAGGQIAVTDARGEFELRGLDLEATVLVAASPRGYRSQVQEIGDSVVLLRLPESGRVAGRILARGGQDLGVVLLYSKERKFSSVVTDDSRFLFTSVVPGDYNLYWALVDRKSPDEPVATVTVRSGQTTEVTVDEPAPEEPPEETYGLSAEMRDLVFPMLIPEADPDDQ